MIRKSLTLALAATIGAIALTSGAQAKYRMISIDHTKQGPFGGPKIVNNGVNDGRVCKIFMAPKFDPWTETTRMVKTKQCI